MHKRLPSGSLFCFFVQYIENGKNYPSLSNLENILKVLNVSFIEAFDFEHKNSNENLIDEINIVLNNHPDKVEDIYKIIMALVK